MQILPFAPLSPPLLPILPSELLHALARRGVGTERRPGEDGDAHERRLETALMALFRDTGSRAAFEALHRIAARPLYAWILHLLTGRAQPGDPAELVQDTFVNVYRYAKGFRDDGGRSFRAWAWTIAGNVVRKARSRRALSLEAMPQGSAEPADGRAGPQRCAQARELSDELRGAWTLLLLHYSQAFAKLSARDRRALELVEVEGLSYAQAGKVLKVGRSNMKMIMFRARKRIRAHVACAMQVEAEGEASVRAAG